MKCPNCNNKLKYEKPTGLSKYSYLCENCKKQFELDMKGNIRELRGIFDGLFDIFNS